jgi:hypothetical protein
MLNQIIKPKANEKKKKDDEVAQDSHNKAVAFIKRMDECHVTLKVSRITPASGC